MSEPATPLARSLYRSMFAHSSAVLLLYISGTWKVARFAMSACVQPVPGHFCGVLVAVVCGHADASPKFTVGIDVPVAPVAFSKPLNQFTVAFGVFELSSSTSLAAKKVTSTPL